MRRVQLADAEALLANLRDLIAEPGVNVPLAPDELTRTPDEQRQLIAELAESARHAMFVAIADDAIVGQVSIKPVSARRALLHVGSLGMMVVNAWRGRGAGSTLITAIP